jgi:hypothetical protein
MIEHTQNTDGSKRARWGAKRGWKTRSAKFSPDECAAIDRMVTDLRSSADAVIHEAVMLHLIRNNYRPLAA